MKTTSNPTEVLPPDTVHVYEGENATLNQSHSLSPGLSLGFIRFNSDGIVNFQSDGSASAANANFQKRFSVNSTPGRISLSISAVTAVDDKANGKFSCSLIYSNSDTWERAIQVQVTNKIKSVGDF